MGCDIHMFPECRKREYWCFAWRWTAPDGYLKDRYPPPDRANYFAWEDRWYWLFGQLAGVRYDGPPIAEPRGVPEDVSYDVKEYIQNEDYHTPSWLTLAELQAHPWEERYIESYGAEDIGQVEHVRKWLARLAELDPNPENVRIVFAFDN